MIESSRLEILRDWFERYVGTFGFSEPELQAASDIKVHHSRKVCEEIAYLGMEIGLEESDLRFAEMSAIFHDIGRFEQLSRFRTFSDRVSINHAELGVQILREHKVLDILDPPMQETLCRVISNHNKISIPTEDSPYCRRMSGLLRDADKIDIWRVVTEYYEKQSKRDGDAIVLGLSDDPEISPEVAKCLMEGRLVPTNRLRTISDFKLMKMGWVFDLNHKRSFRLVRERGYIRRIRDSLPSLPVVETVYRRVETFLNQQCAR